MLEAIYIYFALLCHIYGDVLQLNQTLEQYCYSLNSFHSIIKQVENPDYTSAINVNMKCNNEGQCKNQNYRHFNKIYEKGVGLNMLTECKRPDFLIYSQIITYIDCGTTETFKEPFGRKRPENDNNWRNFLTAR